MSVYGDFKNFLSVASGAAAETVPSIVVGEDAAVEGAQAQGTVQETGGAAKTKPMATSREIQLINQDILTLRSGSQIARFKQVKSKVAAHFRELLENPDFLPDLPKGLRENAMKGEDWCFLKIVSWADASRWKVGEVDQELTCLGNDITDLLIQYRIPNTPPFQTSRMVILGGDNWLDVHAHKQYPLGSPFHRLLEGLPGLVKEQCGGVDHIERPLLLEKDFTSKFPVKERLEYLLAAAPLGKCVEIAAGARKYFSKPALFITLMPKADGQSSVSAKYTNRYQVAVLYLRGADGQCHWITVDPNETAQDFAEGAFETKVAEMIKTQAESAAASGAFNDRKGMILTIEVPLVDLTPPPKRSYPIGETTMGVTGCWVAKGAAAKGATGGRGAKGAAAAGSYYAPRGGRRAHAVTTTLREGESTGDEYKVGFSPESKYKRDENSQLQFMFWRVCAVSDPGNVNSELLSSYALDQLCIANIKTLVELYASPIGTVLKPQADDPQADTAGGGGDAAASDSWVQV